MKRIAIIGGMSIDSSLFYDQCISFYTKKYAEEFVSIDIMKRGLNCKTLYDFKQQGRWDYIGKIYIQEFQRVVSRCDYIAIASCEMHKVADLVEETVERMLGDRPKPKLIHVGDCIAERCKELKAERVALFGTTATMSDEFIKKRLMKYGIGVVNFCANNEVEAINQYLHKELHTGHVSEQVVRVFHSYYKKALRAGAEAIVLSCAEFDTISKPDDFPIPFINAIQVHANKMVNLCLEE